MYILANGRLITRDPHLPYLQDGGVVIDGSKILVVGKTRDLRSMYPDAEFIDAKGGAVITSGSFSGVGTPKTPKGFSSDSSQRSLLFAFNGAGDTAAEVRTADGTVVGAIEARCGYTCAIFSHPELESGTYSLNCRTLTAYADAS